MVIRTEIVNVMQSQLKRKWTIDGMCYCYSPGNLPTPWVINEYKKISFLHKKCPQSQMHNHGPGNFIMIQIFAKFTSFLWSEITPQPT